MDILLFIMIILVASLLQTSTGFGFSILATPFLLLLFEPAEAIQINLILSLVISLALITKIKKRYRFCDFKAFRDRECYRATDRNRYLPYPRHR